MARTTIKELESRIIILEKQIIDLFSKIEELTERISFDAALQEVYDTPHHRSIPRQY